MFVEKGKDDACDLIVAALDQYLAVKTESALNYSHVQLHSIDHGKSCCLLFANIVL